MYRKIISVSKTFCFFEHKLHVHVYSYKNLTVWSFSLALKILKWISVLQLDCVYKLAWKSIINGTNIVAFMLKHLELTVTYFILNKRINKIKWLSYLSAWSSHLASVSPSCPPTSVPAVSSMVPIEIATLKQKKN